MSAKAGAPKVLKADKLPSNFVDLREEYFYVKGGKVYKCQRERNGNYVNAKHLGRLTSAELYKIADVPYIGLGYTDQDKKDKVALVKPTHAVAKEFPRQAKSAVTKDASDCVNSAKACGKIFV